MTTIAIRVTIILLLAGTASGADRLEIVGDTMGTYYSIIIDAPAENVDEEKLKARIEERLADVNRQMSTWDPESEISKFNRSDSTEWFAVSAEFASVVKEAIRIHKLTGAAFDPTVAPLIDLWGFGDKRKKEVPSDAAIEAARSRVGLQHVSVRDSPPALKKARSGIQLNLSAIAKGYGVDALAELLAESGCPSFVVDIGGENRAGAAKANGDPWRIGVESPAGGPLSRVVGLTNLAVATSGDYRNFFREDGTAYSHTIDPVTGRPVENPPASVSVASVSCMTADALATGLTVLGRERGLKLAREQQWSVMFQTVDSRGDVSIAATGIFEEAAGAETAGHEGSSSAESDVSEQAVVDSSGAKAGAQAGGRSGGGWFPFVAAAVIFIVAAAGMGIGVMLQNRALKGSCGGVASMSGAEGSSICQMCTVPKDDCTNAELREQIQAAAASREGDPART